MQWNIAPECSALAMVCILNICARNGNTLPTLRKFFFKLCLAGGILTISFNIMTGVVLTEHTLLPAWILWVVNTVYYLTTPVFGVLFMVYGFSVLEGNEDKAIRMSLIFSIPTIPYLLMVLTNPWTRLIFKVVPVTGYVRGPLIILPFLMTYYYGIVIIATAIFKRGNASRVEHITLIAFPAAAVVAVIVQQIFPAIILTGSATACALLITYLMLENKQISLDALTGLPTRQVLLDMMKINLSRHKDFTLMVLSLRKFKLINNRLGQYCGNLILRQIAGFLKGVAPKAQLYRFSGDEFAILLEGHQNPDEMVSAIIARMSGTWNVENYQCPVSMALGIVKNDHELDSVETMITGAEHAVLRAKERLGNVCVYCTPQMISDIHRREGITEILSNTVKKNDIALYYQPIYDVATSKFTAAECLVRIPESPLGFLSPGEFIPLAEATGIIVPLTYQILEKICPFLNVLSAANSELSAIMVNFSAMQFADENLEEKFLQIIQRYNIPLSKLKIELTESILAENYEVVKQFILKMYKLGLRFELDDFGTGYSNIATVLQIPWDTIKLDRSLIVSATESEQAALVVKNMVKAFQALDICVLAEGVETEEQRDFAISIGCKLIQGFFYAKPVPQVEAMEYF
ncbi:MAG: EAL domain-containing protein [Oscillospiraceae bacterium]